MADTVPAPRTPRMNPGGPIITAAELGIWSEAAGGLRAAREHQRAMRDWAQGLCERERARGHAEGRAAGDTEAVRIVADMARRASAHLSELERGLPSLVHDIIVDVLGTMDDDAVVRRCVRRAVEKMQPDSTATLHVSPSQVDAVRTELKSLDGHAGIEVEADPTLSPGEASLRSSIGSVELGIDAQLRALRAGLGAVSAVSDAAGGRS